MEEITHRELRNDSSAVLRRVSDGEHLLVTNNGRPAAVIGPPTSDALALLAARGELRAARSSPEALRSIRRTQSDETTAMLLDDVRGVGR